MVPVLPALLSCMSKVVLESSISSAVPGAETFLPLRSKVKVPDGISTLSSSVTSASSVTVALVFIESNASSREPT